MIQNVVEEVVTLGAVTRIGALQIAEAEEAQILQQLCVPLSPALTNGTGLEDEFADDVLICFLRSKSNASVASAALDVPTSVLARSCSEPKRR